MGKALFVLARAGEGHEKKQITGCAINMVKFKKKAFENCSEMIIFVERKGQKGRLVVNENLLPHRQQESNK